MKVLFLDDMQERHDRFKELHRGLDVTHTYTALGAIECLEAETFDRVYLDHDLAEAHYTGEYDNNTGYQVACYIAARALGGEWPETEVVVHSWNPAGCARMMQVLKASGVRVIQFQFPCK